MAYFNPSNNIWHQSAIAAIRFSANLQQQKKSLRKQLFFYTVMFKRFTSVTSRHHPFT